ncbi:MAG: hypothetical protein LBR98_03020 [Syntrophomonadaceae bacterium]|jgi:hypothetical protein|nr:hypothetical protein [Syntrophomonadaceae bacterium]
MSKDAIEANIANKIFQLNSNEQKAGCGRYLIKEADIIDGLAHTVIEWLESIEQETSYDRLIDTFAGNSIRSEIDIIRDEIKSLKKSLCRLHERTP